LARTVPPHEIPGEEGSRSHALRRLPASILIIDNLAHPLSPSLGPVVGGAPKTLSERPIACKAADFSSRKRMDFDNCSLFHPVYNNDYSSFCLK
jgi:hypothetical protein